MHTAQLMPLPLTVSCFSKIQIGFTFLVPAHPGSPGKRAVKRVCVCVWHCQHTMQSTVYVSVVCLSICLSQHGLTAAHWLLQFCCCGPSHYETSISYCTVHSSTVGTGGQCHLVSVCRKLNIHLFHLHCTPKVILRLILSVFVICLL